MLLRIVAALLLLYANEAWAFVPMSPTTTLRSAALGVADPEQFPASAPLSDVLRHAPAPAVSNHRFHVRVDFAKLLAGAPAAAADGFLNISVFLRRAVKSPPGCATDSTLCQSMTLRTPSSATDVFAMPREQPLFAGAATSVADREASCSSANVAWVYFAETTLPLGDATSPARTFAIDVEAPLTLTQRAAVGLPASCPPTEIAFAAETAHGVFRLQLSGAAATGSLAAAGATVEVAPLLRLEIPANADASAATALLEAFFGNDTSAAAAVAAAGGSASAVAVPWRAVGWRPLSRPETERPVSRLLLRERPNEEFISRKHFYGYALTKAAAFTDPGSSSPSSWTAVSSTMRPAGFACVADTLPGSPDRVGCRIPLPGSPTRVNISVLLEEGLNAAWPDQLTVLLSSASANRTVRCERSVALGRCGATATCELGVTATGFTEVLVVLPAVAVSMRTRDTDAAATDECAFGSGAVVDFDYTPAPAVSCSWPAEFACADGRACVAAARVCNSVADCADNSDEAPCANTFIAADNATLATSVCSPERTLTGQASAAECVGAALSSGAPTEAGAVVFASGTCALFARSCTSAAADQRSNAGNYMTLTATAAATLVWLPQSAAEQRHSRRAFCTAAAACSGRGDAVLRTGLGPSSGAGCHCRCFGGYVGVDCRRFRTPTNQDAVAFMVEPSTLSAALTALRGRDFAKAFGTTTVTRMGASGVEVTVALRSTADFVLRTPFANGTAGVSALAPAALNVEATDAPLELRAHCTDVSTLQGRCYYDVDLTASADATTDIVVELYAPYQLDEFTIAAYDASGTDVVPAGSDRCDVATRGLEFTDPESGGVDASCVRRSCAFSVSTQATRIVITHVRRTVMCTTGTLADGADPSRPRVAAFVREGPVVPASADGSRPSSFELDKPSTETAFIVMVTAFGLSLLFIATVVYYAHRDVVRIRAARSFDQRGNRRSDRTSLHTVLATWAFRILPRVDRYGEKPHSRHYDRIALCSALMCVVTLIAAIVAGAFWVFPILPPFSPHAALVSVFDGTDCGARSAASGPIGYLAVEAFGECQHGSGRLFENESVPMFIAATCAVVGGDAVVTLHSSPRYACTLGTADVVRAGSCVQLRDLQLGRLLGPRADLLSARLDCVTGGDGVELFLQDLQWFYDPRPDPPPGYAMRRAIVHATGYSGTPWESAQGARVPGLAAGSTVSRFAGFRAGTGEAVQHTSHFHWRVACQASRSAAAFGRSAFEFPGARIVSQQDAHFLLDGLNGQTLSWAAEAGIPDTDRSLPASSKFDLAVGELFNDPQAGAARRQQLRSRAAIRDAVVFPNVAGTGLDVGQFEMPAVGFFLRASRNTSGFVFVLGDDVRIDGAGAPAYDGTTRGSAAYPVLDRLFDVVEGGVPLEQLTDVGLGVTLAVYVNGEQGTLRVYAIPTDGGAVEATFDLGRIGRGRVFANTWHFITLKFLGGLVEIVIDGQSNKINSDWNACAEKPLRPIRVRDASMPVELDVEPPYRATVYPRGALYVGVLNAGLYGLQFYSEPPFKYELNAHSTAQMAPFLGYSTQAYTYLGFYLLFIAGTLMLTMLTGVVSDFVSEADSARRYNLAHARSVYYDIFEIDDRINAISVGGEEYTALTLKSAVSITGLDTDTFALVLEEIRKLAFNEEDSRADLLAFLWTQGKKAFEPPDRLAELFREWQLVESGELSQDGVFTLPTELWEQLVRQHDGEVVRRRAVRVATHADDRVAAGGNLQQLRGLRALRGAKTGTARSSNAASQGGSNSLVQMLLPVTLALQTVAVYSQNWRLPTEYLGFAGDILNVISFDFLNVLPNLDVVVASGVLFGVALVVFLLLVYYAVGDHRLWLSVAASYVIRRDGADRENVLELAEEAARAKAAKPDKGTARVKAVAPTPKHATPKHPTPNGLGPVSSEMSVLSPRDGAAHQLETKDNDAADAVEDWMLPLFRYVVPPRVSVAIDQHVDGARASNRVKVEADDLLPAEVKGEVEWICEPQDDAGRTVRVGVAGDPSERRVPLLHVGCKCPHHTDRWLGFVLQSNVSPKLHQCFVVQSGKRCETVMGKMYTCGYRYRDGTVCPYALCADHAKMTLGEFMIIMAVTGYRTLQEMGMHGIVAFAVVSLVNVFYFPVINVAMQFLTCDARFQCAFPTCWEQPNSRFYLALVVVLIALISIGIGTPLTLFTVLWTRRRILYKFFYHREYHRFYLATDDDTIEYGEALLRQQEEDDEIDDDEEDAVFRVVKHFAPNTTASLARATMTTVATSVPRLSQVSFDEWERYLAVDVSNLFPLYYMLEFEWMFLPPIILLHKAAILAPNVLMEDESLPQFVVTAAVETVFGIFVFWTQPYLNPWVDTIYRAGSVHNIGLLGLISLTRAFAASGDSERLDVVMITWTAVYLGFVVCLLVATVLVPVIGIVAQQVNVGRQMERVGMRTIDLSSLFLNPLLHDEVELTEDEAAAAAGIHDASSDSEDDEGRRHAEQSAIAKEQATKSESERQLARADARRAKAKAEETRKKMRASAVEKTRVMALEDA